MLCDWWKERRKQKQKEELDRIQAVIDEDHSGSACGRALDKGLIEAGLKKEDKKEDIDIALLEAIWTMRFSENKESIYAVLTVEEAQQIVKDIYIELDKIGYEIKNK